MKENVCRKYGITQEQLAEGVTRCCKLLSPKFAGGKQVRLAILCLLCNGDIPSVGDEDETARGAGMKGR